MLLLLLLLPAVAVCAVYSGLMQRESEGESKFYTVAVVQVCVRYPDMYSLLGYSASGQVPCWAGGVLAPPPSVA